MEKTLSSNENPLTHDEIICLAEVDFLSDDDEQQKQQNILVITKLTMWFYRIKTFLPNEDLFLSNTNIFLWNESLINQGSLKNNFFNEWNYILSNKNMFYQIEIYLIERKYISSSKNIFIQ